MQALIFNLSMPRKKTIYSDKYPYHVTTRSNHKTWFQVDLKYVWKIALESLEIAHKKHFVSIHAFVLMNNHYHLVLSTPDANIDKFMYEFNKNFSLKLRIKTKRVNRMFGGRYKWSLIKDIQHYYHVMKYVYLNPNKANIVQDATKYPFSTLYIQKHERFFPTPLCPYMNTLSPDFLDWIHEKHTEEQNVCITKGLQRTRFRFSGTRESRHPPSFKPYG